MSCALLMTMLVTGVFSLIEIVNQCSKTQCLYVYSVPIPKIHVFFNITLIILNGVVILLLYCFIAYLFYKQAYLHQRNIYRHERASDFSVLISGLRHA